MISSTIYVRLVAADKDRGFVLLVGYDNRIVQRTAIQSISISVPTQHYLDAAIERVKANYSASEVRNVTEAGIVKRFEKAAKAHA